MNSGFDLKGNPDLSRERWPMSTALGISLLLHALLLSLTFSGQGVGLPGLDFPWRERRFQADSLHVVLVHAIALVIVANCVMPLATAPIRRFGAWRYAIVAMCNRAWRSVAH